MFYPSSPSPSSSTSPSPSPSPYDKGVSLSLSTLSVAMSPSANEYNNSPSYGYPFMSPYLPHIPSLPNINMSSFSSPSPPPSSHYPHVPSPSPSPSPSHSSSASFYTPPSMLRVIRELSLSTTSTPTTNHTSTPQSHPQPHPKPRPRTCATPSPISNYKRTSTSTSTSTTPTMLSRSLPLPLPLPPSASAPTLPLPLPFPLPSSADTRGSHIRRLSLSLSPQQFHTATALSMQRALTSYIAYIQRENTRNTIHTNNTNINMNGITMEQQTQQTQQTQQIQILHGQGARGRANVASPSAISSTTTAPSTSISPSSPFKRLSINADHRVMTTASLSPVTSIMVSPAAPVRNIDSPAAISPTASTIRSNSRTPSPFLTSSIPIPIPTPIPIPMPSNAPNTIFRSHSMPEPRIPTQMSPPYMTSSVPAASIVRPVSAPCDVHAYTDTDIDADTDTQLPQTFVLPDKASWFNINYIHPIEIEAMPWITGKEQAYLVLRDWMLISYHRSPSHYLSSTTSRTFLGADASRIFTIWWFLNEWQLINFRAKPQTRPTYAPPLPGVAHSITVLEAEWPKEVAKMKAEKRAKSHAKNRAAAILQKLANAGINITNNNQRARI